jgi:uncharacterized repeat protein (TIGR01451 family)
VAVTLDSAAQTAGWSASVYFDANKDAVIDASDVLINTSTAGVNLSSAIAAGLVPLAPAPGNILGLPLLVKLFAPSNATIGATATATLTVTDLNSSPTVSAPACPPATGNYSATVTNGQLSVQKSQLVSAGTGISPSITCDGTVTTSFGPNSVSVKPGDCLVYQVVATNTGNAPVKDVVLSDAIPAHTVYNATQPATQCTATGATGGTPTFTTASGATLVSCGNASTGVTLAPLGTMTLYYAVQVQQ